MVSKKIVNRVAIVFITIWLVSFGSVLRASQTIQLSGNFTAIENHPSITFIINDLDTGDILPFLIDVDQKTFLKEVHLRGDHYKFVDFKIIYNGNPNGDAGVCQFKPFIDNQATMISLYGSPIGDAQVVPACTVDYVAVIPNSNAIINNTSTTETNNINQSGNINSSQDQQAAKNSGYQEIANYLQALKNNCKISRYAAEFNQQSVVYDVRGRKNSLCEVDIGVDNKAPLRCLLTEEDIAVLASQDQIDNLKQGKPSTNSLATGIMSRRCHPLS